MATPTDGEDERDNEVSEPFVAAAVDKIKPLVEHKGKIHRIEEKMATERGNLGNIYKQIEKDFHGNRKAVKLIRGLVAGTTDAAYDFMRTFLPLAKALGLLPEDDLVDQMGSGSQGGAESDEDEAPGVSSADLAPKADSTVIAITGKNAIDRVRERMEAGTGKAAPKGPPGDLDLVDAGTEVAAEITEQRANDAAAFDNLDTNATAH